MSFDNPVVVIVGGGAMGGLLAEGGLDVTLFDIWQEHIQAISEYGLRIVGYGGDRVVRVKATTDAAGIEAADMVLFQCKAFANQAAATRVRHLFTGPTAAVSFRNGLGNEAALARILGADSVLGGLTAQAGLVEAPGVVHNFGDLPQHYRRDGGRRLRACRRHRRGVLRARRGRPGPVATSSAKCGRNSWAMSA